MPQMAPMSWLILTPMFLTVMILTMAMIYFSFNTMPSPQHLKSTKTLNMNLKW